MALAAGVERAREQVHMHTAAARRSRVTVAMAALRSLHAMGTRFNV
jgi:hypothetical protein